MEDGSNQYHCKDKGRGASTEFPRPEGSGDKGSGLLFLAKPPSAQKETGKMHGLRGKRSKLWASPPRGYAANDRGGNLKAPVPRYGQASIWNSRTQKAGRDKSSPEFLSSRFNSSDAFISLGGFFADACARFRCREWGCGSADCKARESSTRVPSVSTSRDCSKNGDGVRKQTETEGCPEYACLYSLKYDRFRFVLISLVLSGKAGRRRESATRFIPSALFGNRLPRWLV